MARTRISVRRLLAAGLTVVATAAAALVATAGPAAAATTPGIDVSRYQGTINWTSVKNAGIQFAFIKATEGTSYKDPNFNANYTNSYNAGVIRGAYHFARPNISSGADPGRLPRQQRRRLVGGQPDPARRARHRGQPVQRRLLLRPVHHRHAQLDPGLPEHLQVPHRPVRGHLHHHQLVEPVHRQLDRPVGQPPALAGPLVQHARHPARRRPGLELLAVHQHRHRLRDQRQRGPQLLER